MISMNDFDRTKENELIENLTSPVTLQVNESVVNIETAFFNDSQIADSTEKR